MVSWEINWKMAESMDQYTQKATMNSPVFIVEFLELYKSLPAVWKLKSREYSDRQAKTEAYNRLVEKLREVDPRANRELVVRKINNLRTSYRRELKKVKRSRRTSSCESVYKPGLWYFPLMSFIEEQESLRLRDKPDANDSDDTDDIIPLLDMPQHAISSPADHQSIFHVKTEPEDISDDHVTFDNMSESAESADYHMLTDQQNYTSDSVKILNNSTSTAVVSSNSYECKCWTKETRDQSTECNMVQPNHKHIDDEFDAIGKTYAYKLRNLKQDQRIFAEKLTSDVLFEAQLGGLSRNSVFVVKLDNSL